MLPRHRKLLLVLSLLLLGVVVVLRSFEDSHEAASVEATALPAASEARADERLPEVSAGGVESRRAATPSVEAGPQVEARPQAEITRPAPEVEGSFWCRLVAEEDGTPIADGRVSSRAGSDDVRFHFGSGARATASFSPARSDVAGLVELRIVGEPAGVGLVEAAGFGPVVFALTRGHGTSVTALELRLPRSATLVVRVEGANSEPLGDVRVEANTACYGITRPAGSSLYTSELSWSGITDVLGQCVLEGLPPEVPIGTFARRDAERLHRSTEPLVLAPGERREVLWRVGGGARLSGWLLDQFGNPVAGRELWRCQGMPGWRAGRERLYLDPGDEDWVVARARTDERGHFVFEDVGAGTWYVGPSPYARRGERPGPRDVAALARAVEVLPGAAGREVELRVHRGLYLRGRVEQPDGRAPPHAWVSVSSELGFVQGDFREGSFRLGPLEPEVHRIRSSGGGFIGSEPFDVTPPAEDLVLVLGIGGSLAGHFVDGRTGQRCEAAVMISSEENDHLSFGRGGSLDFEHQGLAPGSYHVAASSDDGLVGVLRDVVLAEGQSIEGLELRLEPGALLRMRYAGPSSHAQFRAYSDGVEVAHDALRSGTSELVVVPAGEVLVRVRISEEVLEERRVVCTVGEETEVSFVFE